jgi:hypothetical protein
MNKTFAQVVAAMAIVGASILALLLVAGLLLGQFSGGWDDAWLLIRSILLVAFLLFSFRYFLARSR